MAEPRKPTLSPTRIATYLECAVKYRYIYIDKIGRFYLRAKPHFSLGATLHRVLDAFHAGGGALTAAQMVERYQESWIPAGFETDQQEQEYRAAGEDMVLAYHAASAERAAVQAETLFTEKTIKADMGQFILSGRVDRVDRYPDGALEVVDYKSGRMETTREEVADDLAMSIYQLILRRTYPGTRVFGTIYCLRSGIQASAELGDTDAARFADDVRTLGEEIISRDYVSLEPVRIPACEFCDFLPRCERFWRAKGESVTA